MKRFTETGKWDDPWFMDLPCVSKVLFLYLVDSCNNAGFHEENKRLTCFYTGISEIEYEGAIKGLGRSIKGASGWLWIRRFLRHQNNEPLNPQNPSHKQIIRLIQEQMGRFNGMPEFQEFIAPYKGLLSPIGTSTGTSKGKGTGKKGELEGETIYQVYPRKVGKPEAIRAIKRALGKVPFPDLLQKTKDFAASWNGEMQFCPYPATWFNQERFNDDPATWKREPKKSGPDYSKMDDDMLQHLRQKLKNSIGDWHKGDPNYDRNIPKLTAIKEELLKRGKEHLYYTNTY